MNHATVPPEFSGTKTPDDAKASNRIRVLRAIPESPVKTGKGKPKLLDANNAAKPLGTQTGLVHYDRMRRELEACANTDEALDIRQRARAAEIYAHQVNDMSAERQLASIRIRAERRLGELLKEMDKHPGAKGMGKKVQSDGATTLPPRLSDLGISKDQSSQFQQLAAIPTEQFEEQVSAGDAVPTTMGVLGRAKRHRSHSTGVTHNASASRGMPPLSQWVRSQLLAFDTTGTLSFNAADIFAKMNNDERRDVVRVARLLVPWLQAMIDACRKVHRGNTRKTSQAAKAARIAEPESDQRQMVLPEMRGQHDQSGER